MHPNLKSLGISSQQEAAELELDLGIRFSDFTPEHADTWIRQTLYLGQYANTRTFTHAAREAGVSLPHARTWQTENTLGFNLRLEIAVLEYTEEIEVLLLEQVRQPKPSPALLAMLLRAHLPEKYGPARRQSAPRDSHSDHDDDPKPETSQDDRESLDDIRQDLQQLKQFAGLTDPDTVPLSNTPNLSPAGEDTSQSNLSPAGGQIQRGGSSPAEEDTSQSDLSPAGGEIQRGAPSTATTDRHTGEEPPRTRYGAGIRKTQPQQAKAPPHLPPLPSWERTCPVLDTGVGACPVLDTGVRAICPIPSTRNLTPGTSPAASAANSNANNVSNANISHTPMRGPNNPTPTAHAPPTNPLPSFRRRACPVLDTGPESRKDSTPHPNPEPTHTSSD